MAVYTNSAIRADNAWQAAKTAIEQNKADITTLTALSLSITGLCVLFDDLGDKIAAAKDALYNIKALFENQSENFGDAINMFNTADDTLDEDIFFLKLMLQDSIDRAIGAFKKVCWPQERTVTWILETNINIQVIASAEDFKKTEFIVEPIPKVGPIPESAV